MNAVGEFSSLTIAIITLLLMVGSQPKRTFLYYLNLWGTILSIVVITVHIRIYFIATKPGMWDGAKFERLGIIYWILYWMVLLIIAEHDNLLCYIRRGRIMQSLWMGAVFSVAYLGTLIYLAVNHKFYMIKPDGTPQITDYFNIYIYFGVLTAIIVAFTVWVNRRYLPNFVKAVNALFIPVDVFLLIFQLNNMDSLFISFTYTIPMLLYFVLFHSNPFDEITGCQNQDAFASKFVELRHLNRDCLIITARLPRVRYMDSMAINAAINPVICRVCRLVEQGDRRIKVFRLDAGTFAIVLPLRSYEDPQKLATDIFDKTINAIGESILLIPVVKIVAFKSSDYIKNPDDVRGFMDYLLLKLGNSSVTEFLFAHDYDYEDYYKKKTIEQEIIDIASKRDMNDPRVLCYVQPIYSIARDKFISAEALMRLLLDGKIIYPDKFISIAEQNACIHTFTLIMLNKVCQEIKAMEGVYNFDAVTINCSTLEFSNPGFYQEILEVIRSNGVEPKKIRIELTESAISEDFDMLIINMNKLIEEGITFYLDDFGTGYSNMERLLNCPFSTIKFDKSLLYKAMENKDVEYLIESFIQVFKKKGIHVLVEGVETEKQKEFAVQKGFDYVQGYLFAKPVSIEKVTGFFNQKQS